MAGDRVFNFNGANVTFNDIHDNNNCTINTAPADDLSDNVSTDPLAKYLSFEFREKRKPDYESVLAIIRDEQWNDKDHARMALAVYNSGNMITLNRPNTFLEWYRIFCEIFSFQFHEDYTPSHLTPNRATIAIQTYL